MRRPAFLVCAAFALLAAIVLGILAFPAWGAHLLTETPAVRVYLPHVAGPQPTPTPTQTPTQPTPPSITWDPAWITAAPP